MNKVASWFTNQIIIPMQVLEITNLLGYMQLLCTSYFITHNLLYIIKGQGASQPKDQMDNRQQVIRKCMEHL